MISSLSMKSWESILGMYLSFRPREAGEGSLYLVAARGRAVHWN